MNKAELSAKWSKYCDTNKLVDDMHALLSKFHHRNSENGICTLLDEYFTNKEPLIKLLATSNHYIGNMRIVTEQNFERSINRNELLSFFEKNNHVFGPHNLYKFEDANGKTMVDYLRTGKMVCRLTELPKRNKNLANFRYDDGATVESVEVADTYDTYLCLFKQLAQTSISRSYSCKDGPKLTMGTKTGRAFNKVCTHYGIDKMNPQTVTTQENGKLVTKTVYPYNKVFAAYSDLVSDLIRKMYFVISLNPLDYLTMSFGVSWHSCHHIEDGGWKGGCLSYMLDSTSMVTYVVNNADEPIHETPKFYRQMFHYDNGLFVQSRLYPQGNDGATNLYTKFKGFVQEEFAEMLQLDSVWTTDAGCRACGEHIKSEGMHYKDYLSRNDCNVFYPKSKESKCRNHVMTVGHTGLCTHCGKPLDYSNILAHDGCRCNP